MTRLTLCGLFLLASASQAQPPSALSKSLLFHASFDASANADFARGDARLYTAASLKRERVSPGLPGDAVQLDRRDGRYGGCLRFTKKTDQVVFFKGAANLPETGQTFQGSFSFWLRVSPADDLPAGYVDPLQITDKKWNDASFFVDFTKQTPRQFRLGVFSDYAFWNPRDRKLDDIPAGERPLITIVKPPFNRRVWTHVGVAFRDFNGPQPGIATLYLNGKAQGELRGRQRFSWKPDRLAILLGIYYVGQFDDLAVFDRALTATEMMRVTQLPAGIKSLAD